MISCYICESSTHSLRKGKVRDCQKLQILQCDNCGLVFLSSFDHIAPGFYETSGMHGSYPQSIEEWLKETERDDQRRFEMVKAMLPNISLLDFGCGAGGFLLRARNLTKVATGVELEIRVRDHWAKEIKIVQSIEGLVEKYDLITAFHVVEHHPEPRNLLTSLAGILKPNGRLIVEVPSANDALLSLYDCDAFQKFTYWSQHLFSFSSHSLEILARQSGLRVVAMQYYQRYSLANHLYWLANGKPGGHQHWAFLETPQLMSAYSNTLAAIGKTDTLIAHLEHIN